MRFKLLSMIFVLGALIFFPTSARADGIIIPDPPFCDTIPCPIPPIPMEQLAIRYHHVTVAIRDQVVVTHVDQVFYNPNDWQVEGTYLFPIPLDAAVSNFILWVDGKPVEGKVLDAEQARRTYEDIVRNFSDPALLEYSGRGAMQARIFPIPPQGERRIELEYTQVLTANSGLVRYSYPLNTEKFSSWPLESVSINVDIQSTSSPIRAVYSPTHNISVDHIDNHHSIVGYEETDVRPDADFALYYSLGDSEAFHLLTYRDPKDPSNPDGFFLLLMAPKPDISMQSIAKDVLLVLDHSGSMEEGDKFLQAQQALRYILRHLKPEDRFNIITFSTGLETYAWNLRPAEEAGEAIDWVDTQVAVGSTDINRALLEAASITDRERPTYLIFLTDGLPTEGETDNQRIIDNFSRSAPRNLRLFAFGVGYDVDTFLLDSLSEAHQGASTYVLPGDRLDETLSSFYAKISMPVLTDLALDIGDVNAYDIYPSPLPDLFVGSQIVAVGRYQNGGSTTITLTGEVNNLKQTFRYSNQIFEKSSATRGEQSAIPRLWATRKIGYLLNQIRLHGPDEETIDQIVKISIRYGIVTPYTSYLVTEEMPLGAVEQERIANEQFSQMQIAPAAPSSGEEAVQKAAEQGGMSAADSAATPSGEAADVVKIIGSSTFVLNRGIWIDTAYDPETMHTVKVSFLSDDYFSLIGAHPDLAAAFALGQKVIALSEGKVYEVVDAGIQTGPVEITTPLYPDSATPLAPDSPLPPAPRSRPSLPCTSGLLPLSLIAVGVVVKRMWL